MASETSGEQRGGISSFSQKLESVLRPLSQAFLDLAEKTVTSYPQLKGVVEAMKIDRLVGRGAYPPEPEVQAKMDAVKAVSARRHAESHRLHIWLLAASGVGLAGVAIYGWLQESGILNNADVSAIDNQPKSTEAAPAEAVEALTATATQITPTYTPFPPTATFVFTETATEAPTASPTATEIPMIPIMYKDAEGNGKMVPQGLVPHEVILELIFGGGDWVWPDGYEYGDPKHPGEWKPLSGVVRSGPYEADYTFADGRKEPVMVFDLGVTLPGSQQEIVAKALIMAESDRGRKFCDEIGIIQIGLGGGPALKYEGLLPRLQHRQVILPYYFKTGVPSITGWQDCSTTEAVSRDIVASGKTNWLEDANDLSGFWITWVDDFVLPGEVNIEGLD